MQALYNIYFGRGVERYVYAKEDLAQCQTRPSLYSLLGDEPFGGPLWQRALELERLAPRFAK
eukprot:5893926-Alexandrium_andersonii.AAC.1